MVNTIRHILLIGLTLLILAFSAWWLDPQASTAQQQVDPTAPSEPPVVVEDEGPAPGRLRGDQTPPKVKTKAPSLHYLLGIHDARARLGKAVPTGKGIVVGHVEFGKGAYMPNTRSPRFKGVTFVERSGPSKISSHAFATARVIYGPQGLAPGISVVHCFESRHWMEQFLNVGSASPPSGGPMRVLTHSWISDSPNAVDVLRRLDWYIDRNDTIVCAGVNNGKDSPVPYLLATSYNAIAVGTARGGSSGGYTRIEVPGRCKPDIVGPRGLTSFTTPVVAAVAARLLQAADEMTDHAHQAGKAPVIKAVLLAGAVKLRNWQPEPGHPLDEHLGAGIVHFDNSLQILQAGPPDDTEPTSSSHEQDENATGQPAPVRLANRMGWDYRTIAPDGVQAYTFQLLEPMGEASIILTWHRRITGVHIEQTDGNRSIWFGQPRLADLDLHLYRTDDRGETREIAYSDSRVDNVEHIYLKSLRPGRYRLEVVRPEAIHDEPWDYGLAWRVEPSRRHAEQPARSEAEQP